MAVNLHPYKKSNNGGRQALRKLLRVAAGSSQAIKAGEICELSGGLMTPLASDKSMVAILAICDSEVKATTAAGYVYFIIPRPMDIFEFEVATATAFALGAEVYYGTSQVLAVSGSNAVGNVYDHSGIPHEQGAADVGDITDRGTTIATALFVLMTIPAASSYYAALQT